MEMQVNSELACKAIEAMEPYARRFMEKCERDSGYADRYFLAWQQARMILAAYDSLPNYSLELTANSAATQLSH